MMTHFTTTTTTTTSISKETRFPRKKAFSLRSNSSLSQPTLTHRDTQRHYSTTLHRETYIAMKTPASYLLLLSTSTTTMVILSAVVISGTTTTTEAAPPPSRMLLGSSDGGRYYHHLFPPGAASSGGPLLMDPSKPDNDHHHQQQQQQQVPERDEEEAELEHLKDPITTIKRDTPPPSSNKTSSVDMGEEYLKKPVNEETPALSDNANSLKFSGDPTTITTTQDFFNNFKKNHHQHQLDGDQKQQTTSKSDEEQQARLLRPNQLDMTDTTPTDIAQYIFWTGDQRGVANTVAQLLQAGQVDREDAVRFLEEVKTKLAALRNRFTNDDDTDSTPDNSPLRPTTIGSLDNYLQQQQSPQQDLFLSSNTNNLANTGGASISDYEEQQAAVVDSKLAVVLVREEALMREALLEQLIYQLAKTYFADHLIPQQNNGDAATGAAATLTKFSTFVETQAAKGRFPNDLHKNVLEALVQALVDAADESNTDQGRNQPPALVLPSSSAAAAEAAGSVKHQKQTDLLAALKKH